MFVFSGIQVGTVRDIIMMNDTTICVNMVIKESIQPFIKKNAQAVIGSDGLVGSMVLNIFPNKMPAAVVSPGDTLRSRIKISTSDMISTLQITNENTAKLSAELLTMIETINYGKGSLGLLINDEMMAQELKTLISNIKKASSEADQLMKEARGAVAMLDDKNNIMHVLLNDSVAAVQLRSLFENLDHSSREVELILREFNEILIEVKQGNGAVNYLLKDTVLVNNIDQTVKNLNKGSVLLNENLEALRQNMFFRGYFKKQEKQQKKEKKKQR